MRSHIEAQKSVRSFHGSDEVLGALMAGVFEGATSSGGTPSAPEVQPLVKSKTPLASEESHLDWDDHLLFKSIHEQMRVLRESLSRLEYVASEVQSVIPRK